MPRNCLSRSPHFNFRSHQFDESMKHNQVVKTQHELPVRPVAVINGLDPGLILVHFDRLDLMR